MSGIHLHFFQSQVNIQLAGFLKFLLSHVETENFLSINNFLRNQRSLNVVALQMDLVVVILLDCQILGVHGYVFILRLPYASFSKHIFHVLLLSIGLFSAVLVNLSL